jgi:LuxR family maltose regulon positive regulatory protein
MKHGILKREQIDAQLQNVFDYPLTVVVAAMGYGKTTAVRTYLDEAQARYAWLSVAGEETSARYIWNSLTRQLARTEPELGGRLNALGFPVDAPQKDRVIGIITEYAYTANTVWVIDDYHLANAPELDRLLESITRAEIGGLHMVIISRTKPELNIDELRLKGYCHLLRSELFELSKEEIKRYFAIFGQKISAATAGEAQRISEGWITAVYLMIQRYEETGKLEPGRNIESLIETAVMSRYTPEETRLLIFLCILDSFTPQQAVYVADDAAAARTIRRLSADNSLIRYDERTETYKLHHIFSGYLRKRLEEQFGSVELQKLYRRAGEWHIRNKDVLSGLKAFANAREWDLILTEFEKPGISKIIDRDPRTIVALFTQIPTEVKYSHPIGYLTYADCYMTNIDMEGGAELLAQIEQYYRDDAATPPALKRRISGEVELIKSFLFFNDLRKMHECQLKAHRLLDGKSAIANRDMAFTFGSPHTLYLYHREEGGLRWIVEYADQVFHYYREVANDLGTGFEALARAEYYLETGDFIQAELFAHKAVYQAKTMQQDSLIVCADLTLARLYLAQGKFAAAVELINDLSAETAELNNPILSSAVDLCAGYAGAILGQPRMIAGWLISGAMEQSGILYQGMAFNYIVHAQATLLAKNYLKLEALCGEMRRLFAMFNNLLGYLHAYILEAAAQYKLYGMEKAKAALGPALEIGRADRIILPFAEYGLYVLDILETLQAEAGGDAYLDRLVTEAARYRTNLQQLEGGKAVGQLTGREREILRLVAAGQSNREIAAGLYVAEITVRKNITAIYRKLGVEGRAAAVKKAVEMKLT